MRKNFFIFYLTKNKIQSFGLFVVVVSIILVIIGPYIIPYSPTAISVKDQLLPPSSLHWFGTDNNGMDVFSRVIAAYCVDLFIAFTGGLIAMFIGGPLGVFAGYFDGKGLAGALAMGAVGIQMGTRFIATKECEFHDDYKALILPATDEDTLVTTGAFGPIRLLKNEYSKTHGAVVPDRAERMAQEQAMTADDLLDEMERYEMVYRGDVQKGPILLGQTVGGISDILTVKEVIDRIVKEAVERIRSAAKLIS